jgi:uncharacterized membrane protein
MRRLHIFLIIFLTVISVLVALAAVSWYSAVTAPTFYGSSWMNQMWSGTSNNGGMGGMMGNGSSSTSYLWIIPAALIAISIVTVIGVAFYVFFPELRYIRGESCAPQKTEPVPPQTKLAEATPPTSSVPANPKISTSCDVLMKTMTPDEQKILNVLIAHQGKYLQKYVVKESGLSRLKTHRVIARFAQRGIVSVQEFGNTNEIMISDWVKNTQVK